MPREITDDDGITWSCIQAFAGLGNDPEKTDAARVDGSDRSAWSARRGAAPDQFEAALKQLPGLEPRDAVVVGDMPYDAEAARTAGMKTLGVLCGGFAEDALRSAGCVAVYRDPEDLLQNYEIDLSWPPDREDRNA